MIKLEKLGKIESINPATLELIGTVDKNSPEQVKQAFILARKTQNSWRRLSLKERILKVAKVIEFIVAEFDEISLLISNEVGKPPSEAFINEVYVAIDSTFNYYSTAEKIIGEKQEISLGFYESLEKKSYLTYKPVGVVGIIGPYNYPFSIPFESIVQSLMAGNAVVFKPSSETVLVGQKIQELFDKTDLPKGLIQTVFGSGSKIGNIIVDEADKIIFTGSTNTGKKIMARAAETLTPVSLELGGKSAMVVLPDANMDRAIKAARWGVFSNSGQVCASVKRLYLHEEIHDEFLNKLVEMTKQLKQGIPTEKNIDIGAMINEEQLNLVDQMVQTGLKEGVTLETGGKRNPNFTGYFYEPTILSNVTNDMKVVQNEIFGPVLVVIKYKNEKEAIQMVNENQYGLTSSIWTNDIEKGKILGEEINTGTVMVNEVVYTFGLPTTPWGGNKNSGFGRSHGRFGFEDVVRPLHVNVDEYSNPDMWWMPYDELMENTIENFKIVAKSLIIREE